MTLMMPNQQTDFLASDNDDVVLSIRGVSKKFCRDLKRSLMYGVNDISQELLGLRGNKNTHLRKKEFWALQDVSFELRRGEALGLVGKNGSGKSTLLRIIAGLIKPDVGTVDVKGRVAPLIALGAGFNPVLTGRENIYANMSILGLSQQEIAERFEDVVNFAEIDDAIDSPVQSYSSGMAARLGFSCAIHTFPDILLIDEVLAVGDSRFRAKCLRMLHELREKQTSFILVSHSAHTILTTCELAVYLSKGKTVVMGDTAKVMHEYERELFVDTTKKATSMLSLPPKSEAESTGFDITSIFFRNENGEMIKRPASGQSVYFCITCKVTRDVCNVGITCIVKALGEGGETTLLINSQSDQGSFEFSAGNHEIQLRMPFLGLKLGAYTLDIFAKKDGLFALDQVVESFVFTVDGEESVGRGLYYQVRDWAVIPE